MENSLKMAASGYRWVSLVLVTDPFAHCSALHREKELGASEYMNPSGGADLYSPAKFREAGVKSMIQNRVDCVYACDRYEPQPSLSIVNVVMWNSAEAIRAYLASGVQELQKHDSRAKCIPPANARLI